jgi:hypothetical protein
MAVEEVPTAAEEEEEEGEVIPPPPPPMLLPFGDVVCLCPMEQSRGLLLTIRVEYAWGH